KLPLTKEISTMLTGGIYPGMITATIGTVLLVAVVFSSVVIVRRRMRYEWWYAVHLTGYASIALAWFQQIPTADARVPGQTAAVLALGAAPDSPAADHRQGARGLHERDRRRSARDARRRRGPVRRLHRDRAPPRQGRPDRRRDRDHADPRAARRDRRRRRRPL